MKNIERMRALIVHNLTRTDATLDYGRITEAIENLALLVYDHDGDSEEIWYLGEHDLGVDAIIVGAFWHYTEWHSGQGSDNYGALSALGEVFSPGMMDGPEPESTEQDCYFYLNELATAQAEKSAAIC